MHKDKYYLVTNYLYLRSINFTELMQKKKTKLFKWLIFLLLLGVNCWIYINRDNGYAYKELLNYNQLYQIQENLKINSFHFNGNDSLKLILLPTQKNEQWQIILPNGSSYKCAGNPNIKLQEGKLDYYLKPLNNHDSLIHLRLNYVTETTYKQSRKIKNSDVELLASSLPLEIPSIYPLQYWTQSSEFTTEEEISIAKKLLVDSIKINLAEPSITKIEKIGSYILKKLNTHRGTPNDSIDNMSPMQSFNYALKDKSDVWCGHFSNIFSFFANAAGVTTRAVCLEGDANGIIKAGHSFNECYIPELKQWIFVDLTSSTLSVQTKKGKYLNAIDFFNAHELRVDSIMVNTFTNDSLYKMSYNYNTSFYNDFFNTNSYFVFYNASEYDKTLYSFTNKIKRFVTKAPTFAVYSNSNNQDNEKFYFKQSMLWLLLIYTLYWITSSILLKEKR